MDLPALHACRQSRGFTLTELIVVIAIIAVLSAVLIPAWNRSRGTAHATECMGRLRQIGAGLIRYLGDHDQTFPTLAMARESKDQKLPTIDTELLPYVPDPKVFACPADTKQLFEKTGTSYLWNHKLNGQKLGALSVTFVKANTIEEQSRIMVIGDKEGWHPYLKSKLNVLYADGHTSQELTFVEEEAQ